MSIKWQPPKVPTGKTRFGILSRCAVELLYSVPVNIRFSGTQVTIERNIWLAQLRLEKTKTPPPPVSQEPS